MMKENSVHGSSWVDLPENENTPTAVNNMLDNF